MKKIMISILLSLLAVFTFAQQDEALEAKSSRKLTKEEKIELRRIHDEEVARMVDSLVAKKRFVLEADYLSNQTGERFIVNSLINFIIVDSSNIVIQIASTTGVGGTNGMGGVTTRGHISQFKVQKTGRNKNVYWIRLMANTTLGIYDISLNITPGSNTDAFISGLSHGKLNYHGIIKPIERSKVYQGMTI